MKKLNYISALLCAAALTGSCSNEEWVENGNATQGEMSLIATTGADTRTAVDESYNVNWSKDDAFFAFGDKVEGQENAYTASVELHHQSGTGSTGTFTGTLKGEKTDLKYAVYPLSAYTSTSQTVTFPTAYNYPNSNAPMFGTVDAKQGKVNFDQLLSGLLRIKISGFEKDKESTLKLNATGITGEAKLTIANGVATLGALPDTDGEVTLEFTTIDAPMILDIPVPAGTYTNGITATLTIGEAKAEVFKTTTNFVIKAGTAKVMPAISVVEIDGTTIKFSQVVEDVAAAKKALESGVKNITIDEVKKDDVINIPASSTKDAPATINIASVSGTEFQVTGTGDGSNQAVVINAPAASSGVLTVNNIEHVEISGAWKQINATTGDNTLEIQSGSVIDNLDIYKGGINIAPDAEVQKITLHADASIKSRLIIPTGKSMEINVGTHTLTLEYTSNHKIHGGSLTLLGSDQNNSKIKDMGRGLFLTADGAKLKMTNIDYSAEPGESTLLIDRYISNASIEVENCTINSLYYCLSTNASEEVGSGNTIKLTNSTFIAKETALMLNIPATLTATNCTFTGGWQAAFMRGGTSTFDKCSFNLNVDSNYKFANKQTEGSTSWGEGNQAPSASITIGNRGGAYNYKKDVTLTNSCTFSVKKDNTDTKDYPAVYIDANPNQDTQTVAFTYDDNSKTAFEAAGKGLVINNTTGQVSLNGTTYNGPTQE